MEQNFDNPQQTTEQESLNNPENNIPPKNNLVLAIFTTACCCLPVGIYAIVLSTKVNTYFMAGQHEMAEKYAADAKKWSIIGIGVGLVFNLIYALANFAKL